MTCCAPWGWRSTVGREGEKKELSKFQAPWCFSPLWAWQNIPSHSQCWREWAVIVMVGEWECVCLWVCMCTDWPWLNMACGIHSDYGWASLLCNQTNWLTSRVWGWTEFLLWLPLCWVLSTCQPGAEKWEARVLKNRSKDSSSGSSLSIFPPRQLYSQMERGHIHEYRVDPLSAWTGERHDHSHTAVLASCQSNQNPPQMEATKTWPLKTAPQPR